MRILLAHPGQQHSFKVAVALKNNKKLDRFVTCVYDLPDSVSMKIAHKLVRGSDASKILKRRDEQLDNKDVKTFFTFLSLVVIVLSRFKLTKRFSLWLDRRISHSFGIKVAKMAIRRNVDAVICFSNNETSCFSYLKKNKPSILRIVDCANSPVVFMRDIYNYDMKKYGHSELVKEVPEFWDSNNIRKQMKGLELTDYFLAPSGFVQKGLKYCGVSDEKIRIVHYGTNFPIRDKSCVNYSASNNEKLKLVYVGQVSYRKGVHHLCHVISKMNNVQLTIVGTYVDSCPIVRKYKNSSNISFVGHVLHDSVMDYLDTADLFVFASLSEGLSLSCLEALSRGLPIICSEHAGANDYIINGYNGFTFKPQNEDELRKAIAYCIENKNSLFDMKINAIQSVKHCTWVDYEKNLSETLESISKERRSN